MWFCTYIIPTVGRLQPHGDKNLNKMFSCKKTKSQPVITSLTVPDGVVTDTKDICNSLNKYFASVGDKLVQVLEKCDPRDFVRYCPPTNSASMFCTPTDPFEIHKVLMSFKSNNPQVQMTLVLKY